MSKTSNASFTSSPTQDSDGIATQANLLDKSVQDGDGAPVQEQDAFDKLVTLITAEQQSNLVTLEEKLGSWEDERLWRDKVGVLLPEILEQQQDNAIFPMIMRPLIEQSISTSINADPAVLAETLMPSVQISVRRTVQNLFSDMVQQVNRSLDHALNIEWRLEAWRTGRPFAEVVLARTLEYKVEQVFLIDRESGLLLQQVAQDERMLEDGDMVSGMLAAINDFVRDSFKVDEQESLQNVSMGELTLVIEQGTYSYIAAVVRGHAHPELDDILRSTQGVIEYRYKDVLKDYSGDSSDLEGSQEILAEALVEHYEAPPKRPKPATLVLFAVLAALLLGFVGYQLYRGWQWRGLVQDLRAQEHILVTKAQRGLRGLQLEGLYYADANHPHPDTIIAASPHFNPENFRVNTWRSYESPLLAEQLRQQLAQQQQVQQQLQQQVEQQLQQQSLENWRAFAPEGVTLELAHKQLQIRNLNLPRDYGWLERIRQQLLTIPSLESIALENVRANSAMLQAQLAREYIFFHENSDAIYADAANIQQQYAQLNTYIGSLQLINQQQPLRIKVVSQRGKHDSHEAEALQSLLQARAQVIMAHVNMPTDTMVIDIQNEALPTGVLSQRGARAAPAPRTPRAPRASRSSPTNLNSNENANESENSNQDDEASTVDNRAILGHVHIEVLP